MNRAFRLAVLATHPIQYQAHWFRAMASQPEIDLEVFFCHEATPADQAAAGFNVAFSWDVPLLEGYSHRFLRNVARRPSISNYFGLDTPAIVEIFAREDFDALLVCGWYYKSAWQAMRAARKARVPVMALSDSHLRQRRNPVWARMKAPLYRRFINRLDACLAAGAWSREYFLKYGARPERIHLVPHSVDDVRFGLRVNEPASRRGELRRMWGLDSASTVFLFAGKFIPSKRPMDFVMALDAAARGGVRIQGLMVGDGPLRSACEDFVIEHRCPLRFASFLNQCEMADAYFASDALVLPSRYKENWGLVVNEAMSCGRPCIVSDEVGCMPDLIRCGETGFVFPAGDVASLSDRMTRCASLPGLLEKMGGFARDHISGYSANAAVEGVLEALRAIRSRS